MKKNKLILVGILRELDCPPESGRTVRFEGEDQNGQKVSRTVQELLRKYAPFDPVDRGKTVRITIELLSNQ